MRALLSILSEASEVEFIVVGGVAAIAHGSAVKRAAGRAKDFETIAELETLRELRDPVAE